MDIFINFLIGSNVSGYIIRSIVIIVIIYLCGVKIFYFQKSSLLNVKNAKYDYIRKMYYDYEKNKRVFYFSVQEYVGVKLEEEEMDHLIKHNFYFLSKNLKRAYPKIMFRFNEYHLRHPVAGFIWAALFYILTIVPVFSYIVFFKEINANLANDLFFMLSVQILPVFVILSVLSIRNLFNFGGAKCICKYYN
jgi:hypothetical protein